MSADLHSNYFLFVVDTDSYAGNFERELCAFMTGQYGECEVGIETAEEALSAMPPKLAEEFEMEVQHVPDDHGCSRPATIYPTPGWFNNGLGGEFPDDGTHEEEALTAYQEYCEREAEKKPYAEEEGNIRHSEEWMRRKQAPLSKNPAYLSVAVPFYKEPTIEAAEWMVERAKKFAAGEWEGRMRQFFSPFNISAIRLVRLKTDESDMRRYL
jgi:hypothetical protein